MKKRLAQLCRRHSLTSQGLTFVEVLFTIGILAVVVVSLLKAFVDFSILMSSTANLSAVTAKAQSKMEEIRGHNYSLIVADYDVSPGNRFLLTRANDGVDASGIIYIDTVHPGLLKVTIVMSWRNKEGRIIGGDNGGGDATKVLNGEVDLNEPVDGDGRMYSPFLTTVSYVAQRL